MPIFHPFPSSSPQFVAEMEKLQRFQQTAATAAGYRPYDLHREAGGAGLD